MCCSPFLHKQKSERLENTTTKLASVTESLKDVQSQLLTQTNVAACNSSKAKV